MAKPGSSGRVFLFMFITVVCFQSTPYLIITGISQGYLKRMKGYVGITNARQRTRNDGKVISEQKTKPGSARGIGGENRTRSRVAFNV